VRNLTAASDDHSTSLATDAFVTLPDALRGMRVRACDDGAKPRTPFVG